MNSQRSINPPGATIPQAARARNISKLFILAMLFLIDASLEDYVMGEVSYITDSNFSFFEYPIMAAIFIPVWGILADVYGRQRTLVLSVSIVTGILAILLFIPVNKEWEMTGIVLRIFTGLGKAHLVVGKILTTELFSDEWKPWALSTTLAFQQLGALGGDKLYEEIFILPPELSLCICQIGVIILLFMDVNETLEVEGGRASNDFSGKRPNQSAEMVPVSGRLNSAAHYSTLDGARAEEHKDDREQEEERQGLGDSSDQSRIQVIRTEDQQGYDVAENVKSTCQRMKNLLVFRVRPLNCENIGRKFCNLFRSVNVWVILAMWILLNFVESTMSGVIASWLSESKTHGGLGIDYDDLNQGLKILLVVITVSQIAMYPLLRSVLNDYTLLFYTMCMLIGLFIMFPMFAWILKDVVIFVETFYIMFRITKRNAFSIAYCIIQRFSNDLLPSHNRGKFNAILVSTYYLLDELLPTIVNAAFPTVTKEDRKDDPEPYFGYLFCFVIANVILVGVALLTDVIQFEDDKKVTIQYHPDEEEEERQTFDVDER